MRQREIKLQQRREENRSREEEERKRMEADRRGRRSKESDRKEEDSDKKDEQPEDDEETKNQAMLSVLKVIQKLSSNATPETFDTLKKELEEVLDAELPKTGDQQPVLKAEADRVLEYATLYVAEVSGKKSES